MEYRDIFEAISLAKDGDKQAKEYIVNNNMGLVWSIVRKFLNRGTEAEDLFQIGCIGLIKAIEKFDISFDVKFSTYAVPMIMGEIKRHLRDDGIIKVSRSLKELAIKSKAVMDKLSKELCREPTVKEVAENLQVSVEELVMAMDANIAPESINAKIGDDGKEMETILGYDEDMEQTVVNKIAIKEAMAHLSTRERQIIVLRYFKDKTQSQIAAQLGISQVQVSRIEKKVLSQMRNKIIC